MLTFIMLGLVPGTDVQISFADWELLMAGLVLVSLLYVAYKKQAGKLRLRLSRLAALGAVPQPAAERPRQRRRLTQHLA